MFGWHGKVLHINLTDKQTYIEEPDIDLFHKFIGGKGIAGHFLFPHVTLNWDSEDMPILLFTGPLVGTASPTSGRMTIMSRSPLTGTIGDCSVGGSLGTSIKQAGFDGIVITGKSSNLCGIEIDDNKIKILDAANMIKMDVSPARNMLNGKGSTAVIGPAAENGVLFSSVMVDGHYTAGRNGLGLVFASKNLKYITVKGSKKTKVFNTDELKKARQNILRLVSASPILLGDFGISNFGTAALYDLMDARRMMPTNNFTKTHFKNAGSMNAYAYKKIFNPKKKGCKGCHILCKKITESGSVIPEFETMSHFSALLGNTEIKAVMKANNICNEKGMDTISAAVTLAAYAEIKGKNELTGSEILSLLEDISETRGIGKELAKGAHRFAANFGKPNSAITVKGLELPAYDPRGAYGMALAYAVSTRGGCHLRAYPVSHEILRKPVATDRFSFSGKARIIKIAEDLNAVVDSLTACKFIFFAATLEEYAKVYSAVTGVESSIQDLLKTGERIYYNERIMNALNGFSKKDDDLPDRFFKKCGTSGSNINIKPLDKKEFEKNRDNYYKVRGLSKNGIPLIDKAVELNLLWEGLDNKKR